MNIMIFLWLTITEGIHKYHIFSSLSLLTSSKLGQVSIILIAKVMLDTDQFHSKDYTRCFALPQTPFKALRGMMLRTIDIKLFCQKLFLLSEKEWLLIKHFAVQIKNLSLSYPIHVEYNLSCGADICERKINQLKPSFLHLCVNIITNSGSHTCLYEHLFLTFNFHILIISMAPIFHQQTISHQQILCHHQTNDH